MHTDTWSCVQTDKRRFTRTEHQNSSDTGAATAESAGTPYVVADCDNMMLTIAAPANCRVFTNDEGFTNQGALRHHASRATEYCHTTTAASSAAIPTGTAASYRL